MAEIHVIHPATDKPMPVTNAENSRRGAQTKLTHEQVEEIRASPLSNTACAKLYDVHNSHISRIRNHRKWVAA